VCVDSLTGIVGVIEQGSVVSVIELSRCVSEAGEMSVEDGEPMCGDGWGKGGVRELHLRKSSCSRT
jgi:hypothetical protein